MKLKSSRKYLEMEQDCSNEASGFLSEDDNHWAIILLRVYRAKALANNSELESPQALKQHRN